MNMRTLQTVAQIIPGLAFLVTLSISPQRLPAAGSGDLFTSAQAQGRGSGRLPQPLGDDGMPTEQRAALTKPETRPFRMGFTGFVHDTGKVTTIQLGEPRGELNPRSRNQGI
jgi:hypothetical protein